MEATDDRPEVTDEYVATRAPSQVVEAGRLRNRIPPATRH